MRKMSDWLSHVFSTAESPDMAALRSRIATLEDLVEFWKGTSEGQAATIEDLKRELAAAFRIPEPPVVDLPPPARLTTPPLKKRNPFGKPPPDAAA